MSDHSAPLHTHCQNCGEPLQGPYCHKCGQHDIDFHQSFGHVFMEALETWFHFDGKLFRDFWLLLAKPARLTLDFLSGKRASQVPPFRLYLFVSVVFFAWIHYTAKPLDHDLIKQAAQEVDLDAPDETKTAEAETAGPAEAAAKAPHHPTLSPSASTETPSAQKKIQLSTDLPKETEKRILQKLEDPEALRERFFHLLPRMLLGCLPLFALLSKWFSRRAGWVYLQHLVIALHLHTFVFVAWIVEDLLVMGAGHVSPGAATILDFASTAYMTYYFFAFMKRIYGGGWLRSLVRGCVIGTFYLAILGIGMAIIGWFELSS